MSNGVQIFATILEYVWWLWLSWLTSSLQHLILNLTRIIIGKFPCNSTSNKFYRIKIDSGVWTLFNVESNFHTFKIPSFNAPRVASLKKSEKEHVNRLNCLTDMTSNQQHLQFGSLKKQVLGFRQFIYLGSSFW